uniref:Odorant receptor n=1 Tax=Tetranychus urticae TaxID=32264 RepID=T1KH21_TETUR
MLISKQISIISILILADCTLNVLSGSLTRFVPLESSSSNVNKTDKFFTLVDSKAKNVSASQLSEARSSSELLIVLGLPLILLSWTPPFEIVRNVLRYNRPSLDASRYLVERFQVIDKFYVIYLKIVQNFMINTRNYLNKLISLLESSLYSTKMKLHSPSCFIYFLYFLCQSNLLFVSSIALQVTSTLPTLLTNVDSSIPDNYKTTEWSRNDKVEPRWDLGGFDYSSASAPWQMFYLFFKQIIKARNTVIETVSAPLVWSTDKFFTVLETMHKVRVNITRRMAKTKCQLNFNCGVANERLEIHNLLHTHLTCGPFLQQWNLETDGKIMKSKVNHFVNKMIETGFLFFCPNVHLKMRVLFDGKLYIYLLSLPQKAQYLTSTLPTSLTKVNSSIQHNFNTTEWSRNDKVERRDEFPDDQNNLSPGKLVANGIGRMIRAYNSVVETIFLPFNLATEVFFAGLGKLYPIG